MAIGDDSRITKAQGVGRKTAQRIVLELKDKVGRICQEAESADAADVNSSVRSEAVDALAALGYSRQEAAEALAGIEADDTETMIKKALRNLF